MPELPFMLLFLAAIVFGGVLSLIQHRAYTKTVREIAADYHEPGLALVSGRGKGFLKGVALLLVVRRSTGEVISAQKMQGASIFARFKPTDQFQGRLIDLRDQEQDKRLKKALSECLTMLRSMPTSGIPKTN